MIIMILFFLFHLLETVRSEYNFVIFPSSGASMDIRSGRSGMGIAWDDDHERGESEPWGRGTSRSGTTRRLKMICDREILSVDDDEDVETSPGCEFMPTE